VHIFPVVVAFPPAKNTAVSLAEMREPVRWRLNVNAVTRLAADGKGRSPLRLNDSGHSIPGIHKRRDLETELRHSYQPHVRLLKRPPVFDQQGK
jgi:hypothetical protein